ncbi:flavin reductase family protein [Leucobacter sp. W1038]|uniref:flavin reductase family protein n=1 Tax=Leucobacter sp. W1038 TaxID=3438281 RepID=UPI003D98D18B
MPTAYLSPPAPAVAVDLTDVIKQVHRNYPTGVTVVTVARPDGSPTGLAVNAFSSVSLDPPHVLVAVNRGSATYEWLAAAESCAINILASTQLRIVKQFARSGGDKFAGIEWSPGQTGSPLIHGASGTFELLIRQRHDVGTHTVFIGEVVAAQAAEDPAMIYRDGVFYSGSGLIVA